MGIFTPKVRIQRKKKPFLATQTKQLFAFGDVCLAFSRMWARYVAEAGRDDLLNVRIERNEADIALKYTRLKLVEAQTERTRLLNQQTRAALALIEAEGKGNIKQQHNEGIRYEHNCPRCNGIVDIPPSSKTMVHITCPHCTQQWDIYPQGAEVIQQ